MIDDLTLVTNKADRQVQTKLESRSALVYFSSIILWYSFCP